jgi:predicted RNase H-like nuclease (RuvC/YqgF family)
MTLPDDDRARATPSPPSPSPSSDRQPQPKPRDAAETAETDATGSPVRDIEPEFANELAAITETLAALDARYRQIQRDRQERDRLRAKLRTITSSQRPQNRLTAQDRTELHQIRDRLEQLELNLESSLFAWSGLREPIWFGLRYGGLGFILGWVLHALTQ